MFCTFRKISLLLKNKSKFVSLRRVLTILSFILLAAVSSYGQDTRTPNPDGPGKVLKIYPNPATSYITIDLQNNYQKGMTIAVYSFLGKKMYENQNVTEKTTLTITDFNRGIYVYHVTDQSGKVLFTGKFQVSR
jgi:hypothetical protein